MCPLTPGDESSMRATSLPPLHPHQVLLWYGALRELTEKHTESRKRETVLFPLKNSLPFSAVFQISIHSLLAIVCPNLRKNISVSVLTLHYILDSPGLALRACLLLIAHKRSPLSPGPCSLLQTSSNFWCLSCLWNPLASLICRHLFSQKSDGFS